MLVEFGAPCPAFESWVALFGPGTYTCKYCRGNRGVFNNGIDCGFSEIATREPKFRVGDYVYYRGLRYRIRKFYWRNFEWLYIFDRERTPHTEDTLFLTLQECRKDEAIRKVKEGIEAMKDYCERYHLPFGPEIKKLL